MEEYFHQTEMHKFKRNDRWILYDVLEHSVTYIDPLTNELVDLFRRPAPLSKAQPLKEKYGGEAVDQALDALIKNCKLLPGTEARARAASARDTYKPGIYVYANISQNCNMNCKYCYADAGTYGDASYMSEQVAQATIDFLFKEAERRNEKRLALTFFGGEPLLNMSLLKKMVQYLREKEKQVGKSVDLGIVTNGTLLDEEYARYLCEENIRVTISIDGPKNVHDRIRTFSDGSGSYDAIIAGLSHMKAYGKEVGARATVTRYDVRLSNIYQHLLRAGFDVVAFSPVRDDTGALTLTKEDFTTLDHELDMIAADFLNKVVETKKFTLMNFVMPLVRLYTRHRNHFVCGAGNSLMVITTRGDIYPCQSFVGMTRFKVGDVFNGIDLQKQQGFLENADVDRRDGCKYCWARYICGGECYHFSVIHSGDVKTTSRLYCRYTKYLTETALALYLTMTEKNELLLLNLAMIYQTPLVVQPFKEYMRKLLLGRTGQVSS